MYNYIFLPKKKDYDQYNRLDRTLYDRKKNYYGILIIRRRFNKYVNCCYENISLQNLGYINLILFKIFPFCNNAFAPISRSYSFSVFLPRLVSSILAYSNIRLPTNPYFTDLS